MVQEGQAWNEPDLSPQAAGKREWRLLRGGSWFGVPRSCRAAYRDGTRPGSVSPDVGVRPCCPLPPGFPSLPLNP